MTSYNYSTWSSYYIGICSMHSWAAQKERRMEKTRNEIPYWSTSGNPGAHLSPVNKHTHTVFSVVSPFVWARQSFSVFILNHIFFDTLVGNAVLYIIFSLFFSLFVCLFMLICLFLQRSMFRCPPLKVDALFFSIYSFELQTLWNHF